MRATTLILFFGLVIGSIMIFLEFPDYFPDIYYTFLVLIPIITTIFFGFKD